MSVGAVKWGPLYTLETHHEPIVCELLGVDEVELAQGQGGFGTTR